MLPLIDAAKAGVTTGEGGDLVRSVFGQYRGPTGVAANPSNRTEGLDDTREAVAACSDRLGCKMKFPMGKLRAAHLWHIPVIVGGVIPDDDADRPRAMGVARVFTPKDFELTRIMFDIVALAGPEPVAAE